VPFNLIPAREADNEARNLLVHQLCADLIHGSQYQAVSSTIICMSYQVINMEWGGGGEHQNTITEALEKRPGAWLGRKETHVSHVLTEFVLVPFSVTSKLMLLCWQYISEYLLLYQQQTGYINLSNSDLNMYTYYIRKAVIAQ